MPKIPFFVTPEDNKERTHSIVTKSCKYHNKAHSLRATNWNPGRFHAYWDRVRTAEISSFPINIIGIIRFYVLALKFSALQ